jgi:hypothetical protein
MKEEFEQMREQIFEIRKLLGPLDFKLEGLDNQISKSRILFELKTTQLESRIAEHSSLLARHTEQIKEIRSFAKMP